ncbi:MAG: tyrosine--tRNA ligase [Veillonellaceae bacterium]|nr:tyrosine--tRNA ligase [Veillonellaceae bacterium]
MKKMNHTNVLDDLKARGLIFQTSSDDGLHEAFNGPLTIYQGFDPSGDSLTVGHLMSLMVMHRLQEAGHKVIFLIGGGTGRVGDPTGKSATRNLLTRDIVEANAAAVRKQVEGMGLVRFTGDNPAVMLNNDDWLGKFTFLEDFLIEVARFFSVNEMVKMTTFEKRLQEGAQVSLLEFLYPVLQAWDFLHLFRTHNCTVQMGGQDQWGNILQGVELVRKATTEPLPDGQSKPGKEVFAMTFPLITTTDGVKMGKTEKGAVWLDPNKTSPFDLFQYLVKLPDEMVSQLLKLITFLPLEEIAEIVKDPKKAQQVLAFEVTKIVHGEEAAQKAAAAESIPEIEVGTEGMPLVELLVKSGCLKSNSEVVRRVQQGGVRIQNGEKFTDHKAIVSAPCTIQYGKGALLRVVAKQ